MSLPGVESARRRRTSHGRSTVGFVHPPPLHRRSCPHPTTPGVAYFNPLRFLDEADRSREALIERAIKARHRLHQRLRDPAVSAPHTSSRHHAAAIEAQQPSARERHHVRNDGGMRELKWAAGHLRTDGHQDECPVCLDSFSEGQRVVHLPCRHTFHRDCIVPWLRDHCHCPSCRAKTS